eukprot:TRINITY_DN80906_c0_g1_i1.p1 TRINITY_DN80906_c0_g1~~TRINITY_DN80906_c0_g1_i1.p1  ORF type:complete len:480 (+),score=89.21 TRINITY_DN80906_c0_g1_i1:147-1586(+)
MASSGGSESESEVFLNEKNKDVKDQLHPDLLAKLASTRPQESRQDMPDYGSIAQSSEAGLARQPSPEFQENNAEASELGMSYDVSDLVKISVLWRIRGSVFEGRNIWYTMAKLVALTLVVTELVFLLPDSMTAEKINSKDMLVVVLTVNAIVGLLIGFLLFSSIERWYACANGFLGLMNSIRSLHMQLLALGISPEKSVQILRYCMISARCLYIELQRSVLEVDDKERFTSEKFDALTSEEIADDCIDKMDFYEREQLESLKSPSHAIWMWVGAMITQLAKDGEVPPVATAAYARLMMLSDAAGTNLKEVKSYGHVNPPYAFVKLLTFWVAINNMISAGCFGTTAGLLLRSYAHKNGRGIWQAITDCEHLQDVIISMTISVVSPFMYQALLEVTLAIAQPFGLQSQGSIPVNLLLKEFEKDIYDAERLNANPVGWERPSFRKDALGVSKLLSGNGFGGKKMAVHETYPSRSRMNRRSSV